MSLAMPPSPSTSKEPPDKHSTLNPDHPKPTASPTLRQPFTPFFTLITDSTTSTTHHPKNVHYIFSDDDPSLLTRACLEALNPPSPGASINHSQRHPNPSTSSSSMTSKSPSSSSAIHDPTPHMRPERVNRVLLLDLDASGSAITRAHSLSSSWQILSASLTPAPTWAESPSEPYPSSSLNAAGFMLKISGTDGSQISEADVGLGKEEKGEGKGAGKGTETRMTEGDFQALMRDFDQRMKVLRTVVEAGDERGQEGEEGGNAGVEGDGEGDTGGEI